MPAETQIALLRVLPDGDTFSVDETWLKRESHRSNRSRVKDATADYSDEEMHAALEINIPNYLSAIVNTSEVIDSISLCSKP